MMIESVRRWALLVAVIVSLTGCSGLGTAFFNEPLLKQSSTYYVNERSATWGASLVVPWQVDPDCRQQYAADLARGAVAADANPAGYSMHPVYLHCHANGRTNDRDFVALALSGGGARASVFSAAILNEFDKLGIAPHIDLVSGVSGGAVTAAYLGISCDRPADRASCPPVNDPSATILKRKLERPSWRPEEVYDALSDEFLWWWALNRIWPDNFLGTIFTSYDVTDIFAETLSDNLFDVSVLGGAQFTFENLNPMRPNIVLNATNNSRDSSINNRFNLEREQFSQSFTYTIEDFEEIRSDLSTFEIGRAVATSSAFPGVFSYSTLANFQDPVAASKEREAILATRNDESGRYAECEGYYDLRKRLDSSQLSELNYIDADFRVPRFEHLFDGGASDNLGLAGVAKSILSSFCRASIAKLDPPERIIVFVADAQNSWKTRRSDDEDPREFFSRALFDLNFIDAYDTLMQVGYSQVTEALSQIAENATKRYYPNRYDSGFRINLVLVPFSLSGLWQKDGVPNYFKIDGMWNSEQFENSLDRNRMLDKSVAGPLAEVVRAIPTTYGLSDRQRDCLVATASYLVEAGFEYLKTLKFEGMNGARRSAHGDVRNCTNAGQSQ